MEFSQELFDKICEDIASSSTSLKVICSNNNVSYTTFKKWINNNDQLASQYARAKEDQMDFMAEEMISIADDDSDDEKAFVGANHIQRDKLKIETRKWLMSKLKPKKFGEKLDLTTGGETITQFQVGFRKPEENTED